MNTTLPFEVISNEKKQEGKIQAGLKRVEVFASAEKASEVLAAIKERTILTIVDSDKLEEIVNAVKSAIGGGVIAISPMDALIHV